MRYSASTTRPRSAVKYIDLHNLQPHSTAAAAPNRLAQHSPSSPDGSHQSEPISEPKMSPVSLLNGVLLTFNVLCLVAAGSVSLIVYLRRVARLHGHGPHQVLQPAQHQHHLANITSRPVYQNGNDEEDDNDNNNDEEKQCLKLHYSPVNTLINNHVAIAKEFPFEDTVV